jgi:hypothetical protein
VWAYTSNSTWHSYLLNTQLLNHSDAKAWCASQGAQFVAYDTGAEQNEVEQYYASKYNLLLPHMNQYWMGLRATVSPRFRWLDVYANGPNVTGYINWGVNTSSGVREPLQDPGRLCGAAHWNLSQGVPVAWGWMAQDCGQQLPFICKTRGGHRGHPPCVLPWAARPRCPLKVPWLASPVLKAKCLPA